MFRRPERNTNPEPEDPQLRRRIRLLQSGRIATAGVTIALSLTGLEQLFQDPQIFNTITEHTGNIPTSLGFIILRLRDMGLTDDQIAIGFLGISAATLVEHARQSTAVDQLRRRLDE